MSSLEKWYNRLKKPPWAPKPETIGLTWTILIPVIFIVYLNVASSVFRGDMDAVIFLLLNINIISNILFIPFQFNVKNLTLAAFDISITWITSVLLIAYIWPYSDLLAFILVPYFLWVTAIAYLQLYIKFANKQLKENE